MPRPRDKRFQSKFSNWLNSERYDSLNGPYCVTDIDLYYSNLEVGHYWVADEKGDGRPPKWHQFRVYELLDQVHSRSHLYLGFFLFTMSLDDDRNMYVNCELTRKTDMVYFCGRSFSSDIVERYRKPIRILEQLASDKNPTPLQHRSIERWTNDCCVFQTKLEYWLSQKANETNLVPVGDGKFVRSDEIMNAGYVWWNCETYDFLLLYAQCSKHPVPEDRMLSLLHYFDIWFWPRYEFWKFHGLYVIVAQATDPYDSSLLINYERATVNKLVRLLHFDTLAIRYFYKTPLQLYEAHVNWLRMHPPQKSVLKLVRAQTIGAPLEVLRIE